MSYRFLTDTEVAIVGKIELEQLQHHKNTFKTCIYLASDEGADFAVEGGHEAYAPEVPVVHLPVKPSDPTHSGGLSMSLAKKIALAIETAEMPVLVQCTRANRASAGASLYLALKNSWTVEECLAYAEREELGFFPIPQLQAWVRQSVPYLTKAYSENFRYLDEEVAIEGTITTEMLQAHIEAGFPSYLYLLSDVDGDVGVEGGFAEAIAPAFPNSNHIPVVLSQPLTTELASELVVQIEQFPKPVLIQCKGSTRASAAAVLYLAKKNNWSALETKEYAERHQLPFSDKTKLMEWVLSFVSSLGSQP